jgi:quercetin 2,3-dioxygenase
MIKIRKSEERGFEDRGWLQSYHTFSFSSYQDPNFLGFSKLRVINEDWVKGGKGFGLHPHRNMEILTYVVEGALEHRDSLGHTQVTSEGEMQFMSAGSGVEHSEYNLSHQTPVHFFQIWIEPDELGGAPSYAQRKLTFSHKWNRWCLIASKSAAEGSFHIKQDAAIYLRLADEREQFSFQAEENRAYWIQILSGKFRLQETSDLSKGDGASLTRESSLSLLCQEGGELLLFDLPAE